MSTKANLNLDPGNYALQELPVEFEVAPQAQLSPELQESSEAFANSLTDTAQRLPEVAQNQEAIHEAGTELIETFGIKPELFKSPYRSLIFTSISSRLAAMNAREPKPADRQEKEFIADATFLLSKSFTDKFQDLRDGLEDADNSSNLSEAGREAVYDRYTDPVYSKAVEEAITYGLLDDIKEAMGVTPQNEAPYKVRVLSIAASSAETFGLQIPYEKPENLDGLSWRERNKAINGASDAVKAGYEWQEGLLQRSKQMRDELDSANSAPAWVTHINGETQLCISLPIAEKILHREEVTQNSKHYKDRELERDLAYLKHEYVHTQPGFIDPSLDLDFGITVEERRAEFFSGDNHGYTDVKGFIQDIALLTGVPVNEMFENLSQKGRDPAEMLEAFAGTIGVDKLVELMAAVPKNYAEEQSNPVRKSLHEHIGGYDGFLKRLYKQEVQKGNEAAIKDRIKTRISNILDKNYEFWTPEQYESYRKHFVGTAFLQDELVEEITKQRKEIYKEKLKTINFKRQ